MITFLSLASQKAESELIRTKMREQAAKWTEEAWNYQMFEKLSNLEEYLKQDPVLDIISWDVTVSGAIERLKPLRKHYQQAFLLVVADKTISPMQYLRPGILPSSLLLKPIQQENLKTVMEEMMETFSRQFEEDGIPESFVIDTRDSKQYIPFSQICYVEAREKKVYIRTKREEYGFYDTIENMSEKLPEYFCRCHRSYIVNMKKVCAVKASKNLLELTEGMEIPLSRSYKQSIKEYYGNV